jgi:hypothetical protein
LLALLVAAATTSAEAQERTTARTVTGPTTFNVTTGGTIDPVGRFLTIRNIGQTPVVNPRLNINGRTWRSTPEIVAQVVKPGMTDEQKARALWSFARDYYYHWWPATTGLDARDPVKLFAGYGYGFCSDNANALAVLWLEAGLPVRQWTLGNSEHSVAEVFYDGGWHLLDADWQGIYLARDNRTVASVEELIADPELVARGGPDQEHLVPIYSKTNPASFSPGVTPSTHRLDITLRPQEELSLSWAAFAGYQDDSGYGGGTPPIYANGTITSPFIPAAPNARSYLDDAANLRLRSEDGLSPAMSPTATGTDGELIYRVRSPYPIVGASLTARFQRGNVNDVLEVATARHGNTLARTYNDFVAGRYSTDGYPVETSGVRSYSEDGSYPATHTQGGTGTLTYRLRRGAGSETTLRATFYRFSDAEDVRVQVSQDGQSWQTAWVATELGYFDTEINLTALVSGWSKFYLRVSLDAASGWGAGIEALRLDGVDPVDFRPAWSADASTPVGSFTQTIDLAPTTAWFGSAPLYEYLLRLRLRSGVDPRSVGLEEMTLTTTVQVAPKALPALQRGANQVVYADDSTGPRRILITQGWNERTDGAVAGAPAAAIYPANDAHIVIGETLPFVWQRATHPLDMPIYRYQVWLCDSAACTSPLTSATEFFLHNTDVGPDGLFGTADDFNVQSPQPMLTAAIGGLLAPGERYYWRVRAQDVTSSWSPWSTAWSFVVDQIGIDPSAAPAISIVVPTEEDTLSTTSARLRLSGVASSPAGVTSVRWMTTSGRQGVATGTTSWSTGEIEAPKGNSLVTLLVTDGAGRVGLDVLTVTRGGQIQYILPEGATGDFFDLDVVVANPNDVPVEASAQFLLEGGTAVTAPLTVAAYSRQRIRVDDVPGVGTAAVSTIVSTSDGLPLVVERTSSWDKNGYGGHGARAVEATATEWYFAEGAQGYFDTYILLTNTSGATADVSLSFFLEGGGRVDRTYQIPHAARVTVYAGAIPELVEHSFAFEINATAPIAAERATYFGTKRDWDGGHSSTGARTPSTTWFHAEGATGPFFDTFILIGNPGTEAADVQVTYLTSSGARIVRQHEVPAQSRLTLNVELEDPALTTESMATIVESDEPIVSERVSYWGSAGWSDGSISLGSTSPAVRWGVADGRLGGPRAHQTYVLLANPDPTRDAEVAVRFLTSNGQAVTRQYVVPAGRRWNIQVGADAPELEGQEFGVRLESTNSVPIFVARSTYWNALGQVWAGGVSVPGTPLP